MKKVNLNNLELSSEEIDVLKIKSDRRKNKQIMKKRRIFYEKNKKKNTCFKKSADSNLTLIKSFKLSKKRGKITEKTDNDINSKIKLFGELKKNNYQYATPKKINF